MKPIKWMLFIYLVQFFEETGEVFWNCLKNFEGAFELFFLWLFLWALFEVDHNIVNDFFEFCEILFEFRTFNSLVHNITSALEFLEVFHQFQLNPFEWTECQFLEWFWWCGGCNLSTKIIWMINLWMSYSLVFPLTIPIQKLETQQFSKMFSKSNYLPLRTRILQ